MPIQKPNVTAKVKAKLPLDQQAQWELLPNNEKLGHGEINELKRSIDELIDAVTALQNGTTPPPAESVTISSVTPS